MRGDALLRQIHQQLVQLDGQEALLRHRVQVAVQAVDDDDLAPCCSTASRIAWANSPGDSSAGSICCDGRSSPASTCAARSMPRPSQRVNSVFGLSSKMNSAACWPRSRPPRANCAAMRRLAGAGGADDQRARALLDAAAQQRVQCRDAARQLARAAGRARCSAATSRGNTSRPPRLIM